MRAGLEGFLARYPDCRYEDVSFYVAGDRGVGEWTFVGTSFDGERVRIRGCNLFEFVSDRIKLKNALPQTARRAPDGGTMSRKIDVPPEKFLPSVKLRQSYRPRTARFLEIWRPDEWLVKLYGLAYEEDFPPTATVEAAKRAAARVLPQPARSEDRYGIAFVIVHQGQDANWLLVDWWGSESVLHHRPLTAPLSGEGPFEPTPPGVTACVWELPLLMFERDAWVKTVLSDRDHPDVAGYLRCQFNGLI